MLLGLVGSRSPRTLFSHSDTTPIHARTDELVCSVETTSSGTILDTITWTDTTYTSGGVSWGTYYTADWYLQSIVVETLQQ